MHPVRHRRHSAVHDAWWRPRPWPAVRRQPWSPVTSRRRWSVMRWNYNGGTEHVRTDFAERSCAGRGRETPRAKGHQRARRRAPTLLRPPSRQARLQALWPDRACWARRWATRSAAGALAGRGHRRLPKRDVGSAHAVAAGAVARIDASWSSGAQTPEEAHGWAIAAFEVFTAPSQT